MTPTAADPQPRSRRRTIPATTRRKVAHQARHKCAHPRCQTRRPLDGHHVSQDSSDSRAENIVPVCAPHHQIIHGLGRHTGRKRAEELKRTAELAARPLVPDSAALRRRLNIATRRGHTPSQRRDALHFALNGPLNSVGFEEEEVRHHTATQKMLVVYRNEAWDSFLHHLGSPLLVQCDECRTRPLSRAEVADFVRDMLLASASVGLLASLSTFDMAAVALAQDSTRKGLPVLLLGEDDIAELIDSEDRAATLREILRRGPSSIS